MGLPGCGPVSTPIRAGGAHDYPALGSAERYCSWYGDAREGVLYFGVSAFWSAMRSHGGDPTADLRRAGPVVVGRFDLRSEKRLDGLEVGVAGNRSGVWDVLAHPNGRVYFTTFYESAGYVSTDTGAFTRLPQLGSGLNELAHGPRGSLLVSRYGGDRGADEDGAVLAFDPEGALIAEYPLTAPEGFHVAPKTVAYDPSREEIWVTTDLLPTRASSPPRHDAYVLDAAGRELRRIAEPEIQFVVFAPDGSGYLAEVDGRSLWLRASTPGEELSTARRIALDDRFEEGLDFVQDMQTAPDRRLVVTRWSGWVHLVGPNLEVGTVRLPALAEGGLYYTAVATGDRICATYCAGVSVVCADAPRVPSTDAG